MKTRKKFTREFKISILRELENGKSAAQVSRENSFHPSMLSKWKREYKENPRIAFSGNGNVSKPEALKKVLTSLEEIVGKVHNF